MTETPKLNIRCETTDGVLTGTTYLDVIRVEPEDDGSFTAVTSHWPLDSEAANRMSAAAASAHQTRLSDSLLTRGPHEERMIDFANEVLMAKEVLRQELAEIAASRGIYGEHPEADKYIVEVLMSAIEPHLSNLYQVHQNASLADMQSLMKLCAAAGPRAPTDDIEAHLAKLAAAYKGLPELVYAARAVAFGESPTDEAIQRLDAASEYYAETFPWEDEPETPA